MKKTLVACTVNGIMFGLLKLLYEVSPAPLSAMLYCTFLGFTVTFAVGAQKNRLLSYFVSFALGLVWAGCYIGLEALMLCLPLPETLVRCVAFGLVSFLIEVANKFWTPGTFARLIPVQFAVVIGIFSQQGNHIPWVLLALLVGFAAAMLSAWIYRLADTSEEKVFTGAVKAPEREQT